MEKRFVTKWALTKGILEMEGSISERGGLWVRTDPNSYAVTLVQKRYVHETWSGAVTHANEMRLKEIKRLRGKLFCMENTIWRKWKQKQS